jgi:hypothetical protein
MASTNAQSGRPGGTAQMTPTAVDAGAGFAQLDAILRGMDLAELIPWARQQFVEGATADQVTLGLRSQDVFRQKYRVIFEREARGLPPVTVNDVVNYRQKANELATMYGLPSGFLDVNELMLRDVSANELAGRVQTASAYVDERTDITSQLQELYGLDRGAAIAYVLDPDTGAAAVQRTYQSAQVAAQAARQGFGQLSKAEAEQLAGLGISEADAARGFSTISASGELVRTLEGEAPGAITRQDQLDVVAGSTPAQQKLERVQQERKSVFAAGGAFEQTNQGMVGLGVADQ